MRFVQCLVLAILSFGGARLASAQAIILGSTAVGHLASTATLDRHAPTAERAARYAVCGDEGACKNLHPYRIEMEVFPHWDFRVPLPAGFILTNHNWTMEHDAVNLSLRQAMIGGTVRYQHGNAFWLELGGALAEQSMSHPMDSDLLASGDVGRMLPAVLGGVGGWIHVSAHTEIDLRLRAGTSVAEDGQSSVWHANLVVAFGWE